ncbi:MAG: CPBP family intramembrane metalloprotease [Phycisphaeraceae bacterium]|nr:CPBP family intramembrane metalloprotease [Phycisphaeraceae bacterium]
MELDYSTFLQLSVLLPASLLAVIVLYKRGLLSKKSLNNRPIYPLGIEGIDLAIGMLLILLGMVFASQVGANLKGDEATAFQKAIVQLMMQFCSFGPLMVYVAYKIISTQHRLGDFGLSLHKPIHWQMGVWSAILCIPILMSLSALVGLVSILFHFPTPEIAHELLETISQTKDVSTLIALLSSAIIVAPLIEEFVFRGFLQHCMRDIISAKTPWVNIILCSLIFASVHIGAAQWQTMPALFTLGCILGWMYERTASLWPCIILHAIFNALNISIVLLLM